MQIHHILPNMCHQLQVTEPIFYNGEAQILLELSGLLIRHNTPSSNWGRHAAYLILHEVVAYRCGPGDLGSYLP